MELGPCFNLRLQRAKIFVADAYRDEGRGVRRANDRAGEICLSLTLMEPTEGQASAVIVKLLHLGNSQVISAYPDGNFIYPS
jgi:hypothetical protein